MLDDLDQLRRQAKELLHAFVAGRGGLGAVGNAAGRALKMGHAAILERLLSRF
jgi:hypothetical protein